MFEAILAQTEGQPLITPARLMLLLIAVLVVLLVIRLFRWLGAAFRRNKPAEPVSKPQPLASKQPVKAEDPVPPPKPAAPKPRVSVPATSVPAQEDQTVFSDIGESAKSTAESTKQAAKQAVEAVKATSSPAPSILKQNYDKTWTDRTLFVEDNAAEQQTNFVDSTDWNGETHPNSDGGDRVFGPVTPVLASLLPESAESKSFMKKTLVNAGYFSPHAWQNLAAVRYLGLMLPLIGFLLLLVFGPARLENLALWGLFFGPVLGWALPRFSVISKAKARLSEIELAMPDVLDMLNMCVSQGLTLPHSLKRVSEEMGGVYPAISEELAIVTQQAELGTLDQALTNFSTRVDVPEVHSFTSLLKQTERMGTSVTEALAEYSDGMRESLRQRADQKAGTATFKLLFPTVLCLMPAVFLFLLGPAIIDLYDFFYGGAGDSVNEFTQNFRRTAR